LYYVTVNAPAFHTNSSVIDNATVVVIGQLTTTTVINISDTSFSVGILVTPIDKITSFYIPEEHRKMSLSLYLARLTQLLRYTTCLQLLALLSLSYLILAKLSCSGTSMHQNLSLYSNPFVAENHNLYFRGGARLIWNGF